MSDATDGKPRNKLAELIDQYDLAGLGKELKAYWTGEGVERKSLRDLAEYFNKELLKAKMEQAGMSLIDNDAETIHRNLTDDSVSAGVRTDTENTLSENGIDPEQVRKEFISYQTLRTYLKAYQNAEYSSVSDEEKIKKDREMIDRLTNRSQSVAVDRIQKLISTDRISSSNFEVFVEMDVLCQDCGTQYSIDEYLDMGGCDCQ